MAECVHVVFPSSDRWQQCAHCKAIFGRLYHNTEWQMCARFVLLRWKVSRRYAIRYIRLTDNIIIKSCTINTFISPLILHWHCSFSHEFNKLSLATCVVTIFITPSPWKCIPLPWLYRLYYRLWVSRRIDTWQIVYLSNKDPCPKISIHKSEIKVGLPWSRGQRWKFTSFTIHKVARPSGTNLQLAAVHDRPWGH